MSGFTFTEAQQAALDIRSGKLVLAGAGSGKSTVLVERYIRLLGKGGHEPRNIVAMTFSRKAAASLQAKVHQALLEREQTDPSNATHWRAQRERMPWAWIGTIHSICGKLLRSYPLEAGVDPDFVIGGAQADQTERIHDHLRRLAYRHDPDLAALLSVLPKTKDIEALLKKVVETPELAEVAGLATDDPDRANQWLNEALPALAQAHRLPKEDLFDPALIDHRAFVSLLAPLYRIAQPLLPNPAKAVDQLQYDDLERYALRLLESDTSAARTIREQVHHLLVDEFQDTSARQWRQIRAMVSAPEKPLATRKLFLVGDAKQSIYGFRAADVTVVRRAEAEWREVEPDERVWRVNLNDNFRTLAGVIEPLNHLFDNLLEKEKEEHLPFEAEPEPLAAKRATPPGADASAEMVLALTSKPQEGYGWLAKRLRQEVEGKRVMIEDETTSEVRPLCYEDIGILFPTRTHLPELEEALRAEELRYTVVKGGGFYDRQEVLDMMHLIAALADPRDHLALAGVLRSPLFTLSDPAVTALFLAGDDPQKSWEAFAKQDESVTEWVALLPDEDVDALVVGWQQWRELLELSFHGSPSDLLLRALELNGGWTAYATGRRGDQRIANLYQFLDRVRSAVEEGYSTMRRLNDRLKTLRDESDQELDVEADIHQGQGIRLMTIHASKGLEFPYVVNLLKPNKPKKNALDKFRRGHLLVPDHPLASLADPVWGSLAEGSAVNGEVTLHATMREVFEKAEELAETARLLYVAATRARDRLLVYGTIGFTKKGELDIQHNSQVELWTRALGIEVDDEGMLTESTISGLPLQVLDAEQLVKVIPASLTGIPLENTALPELDQPDDRVRLYPPPPLSRWTLPMTAFTSYLADGSVDALRELVWYASSGLEPGEVEGEEGADAPATSVAQDQARRFAAEAGDLLHRSYQAFGPGCSWEQAEPMVASETSGWARKGLDGDEGYFRLKTLIKAGETLGLKELPAEAKRELPLLMRFGEVTLRGRADLAYLDGDTAVAVDYKTNAIEPDDVDELVRSHGYDHQAKLYAIALAKAWKTARAECRLVFLGAGKTVAIEVNAEDEAFYRDKAAELTADWVALERKG